jgi:molybdopterin-guanine dinucleotide biosynthesis protein A
MGRDKACLPFGPELMLQRVVRLVSQVVDPNSVVVVAAAQQVVPPLSNSIKLARDAYPERGPLEGLAAGLRALGETADAIYATSCDVPLLVPGFVEFLFQELGEYWIAVPQDDRYQHPLAAVYRRGVLDRIEALLAKGHLRPRDLFAEVPTRTIPVEALRAVDPDLSTLMNLNHPQDYEAALRRAGFGPG